MEQDLHNLRDDMVAFIEGHGMKRFRGYVKDDLPSVHWIPPSEDHPDAWKDFVELAKSCGVNFVTMSHVALEAEDIEFLVEQMEESHYLNDEDMEEVRWLRNFVGKIGHVQIGFPCQGVMFLYEVSTDWYENFERLESTVDEFGGILMDDTESDED
ncbi:MAG TPA: hypothetical protein VKZ53_29165 [Candidatus Angelobacter sp.]|nr:hypothetical protein [Candidatus Angelobacter sp.]